MHGHRGRRARRRNDFKRFKVVNGVLVDENNRALVFTFTAAPGGTWKTDQQVFVYAVDDPRSEGDRVVVVQHSTISDNPKFDQVQVRNVEVMVRDNDTPGIYVTQVTPGTNDEDQRSIVIEGGCFDPAIGQAGDVTRPRPAAEVYTGRRRDPDPAAEGPGPADDPRQARARRREPADDPARNSAPRRTRTVSSDTSAAAHLLHDRLHSANWVSPVRVRVNARPDAAREDPQTAVITFVRDDSVDDLIVRDGTAPSTSQSDIDDGDADPTSRYVFPNLRSGTGTTASRSTTTRPPTSSRSRPASARRRRSAATRSARRVRRPAADRPDDRTHPADQAADGDVDVAILTDGMVDVPDQRLAITPPATR